MPEIEKNETVIDIPALGLGTWLAGPQKVRFVVALLFTS